jgi:SAM-dependent methyltransferase
MSVRCAACDASGAGRDLGVKDGFALRECGACRSLYVATLPTDAAASALYAEAYREPEAPPPHAVRSLERLVDAAAPWRSPGRWLDVGFGAGDLLDIAAARGWQTFGAEVSRPALARAQARGHVVADAFADEVFRPGSFDVVTMIELVEHVPAAAFFLAAAHRLLRPGGLLYLSTPNALSLNRRVLGSGWSVVSPPDHLVLFSPRALTARVRAAGFAVRTVRCEGLNPAELLARLRRRQLAPAFHRQEAATQVAEAFTRSPLRRAAKRAANSLLSPPRLGDTLKIWSVRQ